MCVRDVREPHASEILRENNDQYHILGLVGKRML